MKAVFFWGPARGMHGRCRIRDANCAAPPHAPRASTSVKVPRGSRSSAISDNWIARSTICAARRRIYPRPLPPPLAAAYTSCHLGLAYGRVDIAGWTRAFSLVAGAGATVFLIALVHLTAVWHALRRPLRRSKPISSDRRYRQSAADLFGAFAAVSRKPRRTGPHQGNGKPRLPVRSVRNPVHNRGRRSTRRCPAERRPPA